MIPFILWIVSIWSMKDLTLITEIDYLSFIGAAMLIGFTLNFVGMTILASKLNEILRKENNNDH